MADNRDIYAIKLLRRPYYGQNVVWGNYESISIEEINSLIQLTNCIKDTEDFIASNMFFLYNIPSIDTHIKFNNNNKRFYTDKEFNFIAITLFTLTSELISTLDIGNNIFTDRVCLEVKKCLQSNYIDTDKIRFDLFGSLGTNHVATVCLANNIVDCLNFVESVQKIKLKNISYFDTSFTLISFALKEINEDIRNEEDGYANIQITYHCHENFDNVIAYLNRQLNIVNNKGEVCKDINIFSSLGEYDIVVQLPIAKLNMKAYLEGGILHPNTNGYSKYIYQCNTRFSIQKKNVEITDVNNEGSIGDPPEYKLINEICKEIKISLCSKAKYNYLDNILSLLYADFRKIVSLNVYAWTDDINEQFKAIFRCLDVLVNKLVNNGGFNKKHLDFCLKLIEISELTLNHVEQSSYFRLEPARIYLNNTGSYDKIFRCCYGIVKTIIAGVYSLCNPNQSNLIPFITFDAAPLVSSEILLDLDTNDYNERILSITVPRDFYSCVQYYIPLFIHEIGHYVCPSNRELRNKRMYTILFAYYIQKVWEIFKNKNNNTNKKNTEISVFDIVNWLEDEILNNIDKLFSNKFEKPWKNFYNEIRSNFKAVLHPKNDRLEVITLLKNCIKEFSGELINIKELNLQDSILEDIDGISDGIREAFADMIMITWSGMNKETYIAYIFSTRIKQCITSDNSLLSTIRIGCIFDMFLNDTEYIISKKDFMNKFSKDEIIYSFECICKNLEITLVQEAFLKFYEELYQNYISYQSIFHEYRKYFNIIIKEENYEEIYPSSSDKVIFSSMKELFEFLYKEGYKINEENDKEEYIKLINKFYIQSTIEDLNNYYNTKCKKIRLQIQQLHYGIQTKV